MPRPKILVVDDEPFNVDYLEQELDDLGYDTVAAANGQEALAQVAAESPDLVLLDIMMPIMDGFTVLARLKADPTTRDIPVIIISAMNDLASIVKGIQGGAEDYLPKPFEPVLLQARITSGLDKKLRRDRENEYLREVERLTEAAEAVQGSAYDEEAIAPVTKRSDSLGNLARVFQKMAAEVVAREQRLKRQLRQLQLDIEEERSSASDTAAIYIPMDRRQALLHGTSLPEVADGSVLVADISGFTPLTASFAKELGLQRGAEEITRVINQVYTVLIAHVHQQGGSVVGFGGDAITCWFASKSPMRAVACALAMQQSMAQFAKIAAPGGMEISIGVKVAVGTGPARRLLVGDPGRHVIDVLAGRMLDDLAEAERNTRSGEVLASAAVVAALSDLLTVSEWREGKKFAVIAGLSEAEEDAPWPEIPAGALTAEQSRAWLPPAVYEKVQSGHSAFLSELRPATSLFLKFDGIDYDADGDVRFKLDAFVRWVQSVVERWDGAMLQLAIGDKGSCFNIAFGAPVAHYDDARRAVCTALELVSPLTSLAFVTSVTIGLAHGPIRAGAYGSPAQRAYTVIGDKTNLAARLMMAAAPNTILCDEAVYAAAREQIVFESLGSIMVKGKTEPVTIYRPVMERPSAMGTGETHRTLLLDQLAPAQQMALKTASVIGQVFSLRQLRDIYPDEHERQNLDEHIAAVTQLNLIAPVPGGGDPIYTFVDAATQDGAYHQMLFAQRRQLHRAVAEWHERVHAADLSPHYPTLARHWRAANEPARAIHFLEQAAGLARKNGAYEDAQRYLNESLAIDATSSVLSSGYQR